MCVCARTLRPLEAEAGVALAVAVAGISLLLTLAPIGIGEGDEDDNEGIEEAPWYPCHSACKGRSRGVAEATETESTCTIAELVGGGGGGAMRGRAAVENGRSLDTLLLLDTKGEGEPAPTLLPRRLVRLLAFAKRHT